MSSSGPSKFVPAQWLKVAQRQGNQTSPVKNLGKSNGQSHSANNLTAAYPAAIDTRMASNVNAGMHSCVQNQTAGPCLKDLTSMLSVGQWQPMQHFTTTPTGLNLPAQYSNSVIPPNLVDQYQRNRSRSPHYDQETSQRLKSLVESLDERSTADGQTNPRRSRPTEILQQNKSMPSFSKTSSSNSRTSRYSPMQTRSMSGTFSNQLPQSMESEDISKENPLKKYQLHREWCEESEGQMKHNNVINNSLTVLSYNILSQTLLENNMFLYKKCDQDALNWAYRWKHLDKELKAYNSDIVCLQEVEECHFKGQIKPSLERLGYYPVYKKRSGTCLTKPDGVVIAVKISKFQIVKIVPVEYYRKGEPLANWQNVGLIVIVKMRGRFSDVSLCVCNTHLLYNPKRGDGKLTQLATLLAEVERAIRLHRREFRKRPAVVMCGDFNSTPTSPLVRFVTTTRLDCRDLPVKSISGQQNNGGGKVLPENFIPKSLSISQNCTFLNALSSSSPAIVDDADVCAEAASARAARHDDDGRTTLTHSVGALKSSGGAHQAGEATTTQDRGITVDYVFYSDPRDDDRQRRDDEQRAVAHRRLAHNAIRRGRVVETTLALRGRLSYPGGEEIAQKGWLPNRCHPSDHLPVFAQFAVDVRHT